MAHEAKALQIEKSRLVNTIRGRFLGIIGDPNHTYGFHVAANQLPSSDYSLRGLNKPIDEQGACCAIDIGMNWRASRAWLRWLIREIREDRIKNIAEVIGSYDGRNVRYWSDSSGWHEAGVKYTGSGHDSWTHVAIYRRDAKSDRGILKGWNSSGYQGDDDMRTSDQMAMPDWILKAWPGIGDGDGKLSVATTLISGYGHSRMTNDGVKQVLTEQKAAKLRDEAILAAVKGTDSAAIIARIDQHAAAEAKRDTELLALVNKVGSGELKADEVVKLIGQKLTQAA